MSFISILPFARWPEAPQDDEPAHGYFLRLVEAQGEVSVKTFNVWNDFESETIDTTRMLATIDRHPMPEEWKTRLRDCTPLLAEDGDYALRGHSFPKHHISFRRRWCAGCIHEHPHHRV